MKQLIFVSPSVLVLACDELAFEMGADTEVVENIVCTPYAVTRVVW